MSKQSSIEWLVEQIKKDINLRLRGFDIDKAFEQAKAMHNEEVIESWSNGYDEEDRATSNPIKYYNETFK